MKQMLPGEWSEKIRVESAGTMGFGGYPSSELACRTCAARGIDITGHVSRELTGELVMDADIILVMEHRHLARVKALGGENRSYLVTDYPNDSGTGEEVEDPIGMGSEIYVEVFEKLEREISKVVRYVTDRGVDVTE